MTRHNACNARTIIITKRKLRQLLGTVTCRYPNVRLTGYVFILYPRNEFRNLPGIRLTGRAPGPAVTLPTDPGPPTAGIIAQTNQWNYRKEDRENYLIVLEFTRETIQYNFLNVKFLLSQQNENGTLTQDPHQLLQFLWETRATRDDRDREIMLAENDINEEYDTNDDINTFLEKKQDARYRLWELAQGNRANDPSLIRATILGLQVHAE